jgi:hypothetical protein
MRTDIVYVHRAWIYVSFRNYFVPMRSSGFNIPFGISGAPPRFSFVRDRATSIGGGHPRNAAT